MTPSPSAAGTLSLGAFAVPYGVLPAVALVRADGAWRALDGARSRTEATGSVEGMSAEERAAGASCCFCSSYNLPDVVRK